MTREAEALCHNIACFCGRNPVNLPGFLQDQETVRIAAGRGFFCPGIMEER